MCTATYYRIISDITSPNTEKVAIQEKEGENKKRKRSSEYFAPIFICNKV